METEIFPAVELDDPTLPWLFSPEVESSDHRLQPWLCLVVVRVQPGVTLDAAARTLTIAAPVDPALELPNLAEAWALGARAVRRRCRGARDVARRLSAPPWWRDPAASLSRLVCLRKLIPETRYIACVVPTYAAGVEAGLGVAADPDGAPAYAWPSPPTAPITLPSYFSFSFSTGADGDFLSLAQALAHPPGVSADGPDGLGARTLDLTRAGLTWPSATGQAPPLSLPLPGMLRPANAPSDAPAPASVQASLRAALQPANAQAQLRPPVYGAAQAGVLRADLAGSGVPAWLAQLNFDPRLRVFAGLAAQVIASEQEDLVAAAWQQVEQAREVNTLLARAQLARTTSQRQFDKHVASSPDSVSMLQLTSPQAQRTQLKSQSAATRTGTPWNLVRQDPADPALATTVSATYRRMARPRGPHARERRGRAAAATSVSRAQLTSAFTPAASVESRVLAERVSVNAAAAASPRPDPIRELSVSITFPGSMVVPLARLAPDTLLPGSGSIPPNTALSLATNPAAIGAYMVGLNSEIMRELLWRGVPVDRRSTPFTWFWDVRGQGGTTPDVSTPIANWSTSAPLDTLLSGSPQLVLAVRAELFRRYPRTAVYAVRAQATSSGAHTLADETVASNVLQPQFTASMPPDLRLFGFALSPITAIASPGWFFVLQEQASETRFGCQQTAPSNYWSLADLRAVGGVSLPATSHAAHVADAVRFPPVRCAIHARALLPSTGGS